MYGIFKMKPSHIINVCLFKNIMKLLVKANESYHDNSKTPIEAS
jgi:hypothetical protein